MRPSLDTDFFDPPHPRPIAHRGASGGYPENTLAAFQAAAETGVPYFELDVHMTRDGVVVVSHDPDLRRTCGIDAAIKDLTLAELERADAGWNFDPDGSGFPFRGRGLRILTLAGLFGIFPKHRYVIEIKQTDPSVAAALLDVVDRCRMRRRVLVASEHQAPIDEVRMLAPEIPTGFPYGEVAAFVASMSSGAEPYHPHGDALQIPPEYESWRMVTRESVAAAHRIGVEVHVWTINDPAEMRAMLALGVDGILTDYPERLMAVL